MINVLQVKGGFVGFNQTWYRTSLISFKVILFLQSRTSRRLLSRSSNSRQKWGPLSNHPLHLTMWLVSSSWILCNMRIWQKMVKTVSRFLYRKTHDRIRRNANTSSVFSVCIQIFPPHIMIWLNTVWEIAALFDSSPLYLLPSVFNQAGLIPEYLDSHPLLGGWFKAPGDLPKAALTQEALHHVGGGDSMQEVSTAELRVWEGREGS